MQREIIVRKGNGPLLALMAPPMMKMTLATGEGQELCRANLSLAMKSATISENIKACLAKAWEMTL